MIDTDLLDLVNSGNAWVFVGSGVSVDSGLPSWGGLVSQTIGALTPEHQLMVENDAHLWESKAAGDFARCFQRIQNVAGREVVIDHVRRIILDGPEEPGELVKLLADWPAAGYLTTNYDDLIESALELKEHRGWILVGNQPHEVRQASGDVKNIVWHIHGAVHMPETKSRLVVGSDDYDDFYLENSAFQQQLRSFLTQRRLVFVGFGLRDPEIMRLLKIVGRHTVPERPIYAFLGTDNDSEGELEELRNGYNIEVKKYRIIDDTHGDLLDLLNDYSSMIIRRSATYGSRPTHIPSYDADTTGLLIYNTLILQNANGFRNDELRPLLSARILSVAEHRESVTLQDLYADVGRISAAVSEGVQAGNNHSASEIESVIEELESKNLITTNTEGDDRVIRLTGAGRSFVTERAGVADRIRAQFSASLASRANEHTAGDASIAEEVAITAGLFFEDCIEKRSLGVAKVLNAPNSMAREFQMAALLQTLPGFFNLLSSADSARALIKLVQGVLSSPSEAEAKHCGLLLQARFGVHLLGVDQNTLKSRVNALKDTMFVLDSTSLIPLLAVAGTGHSAAAELMSRIQKIGAKAITTNNLVIEVREHASYASRAVSEAGGSVSAGVLNQSQGETCI